MIAEVTKGKGTVFIRSEVCKGCSFCVEFCPAHALEISPEFNAKGYHFPLLARPEDCSGCDTCGLMCPDFAIFGVRLKKPARRSAAFHAQPA